MMPISICPRAEKEPKPKAKQERNKVSQTSNIKYAKQGNLIAARTSPSPQKATKRLTF